MSSRVLFYFVFVFAYDKVNLQRPICDNTIKTNLPEGNVGDVGQFPWLGVLRVHSHEDGNLKIGITGLVLVKPKYAVVHAEDVAQIPKGLLMRESKAMFILKDRETWSCGVKSVMMHPEYEYSTYNTIALVELDFEDDAGAEGLIPICQPNNNYNTSNHLYTLGFVDDNRLLEKIIHKIQYVRQELCEDFYNRIGVK